VPKSAEELLRRLLRRDVVRYTFLVYFVALMVQLWLFALWALGHSSHFVPRPNAVAGIIPIGAYMSFFAWLKTGLWDTVLPAGVVIIISALVMSLLLKRGFCGWICPVGAFFQIPADIGKRLRKGGNLPVHRWVDLALRGLRDAMAVAAVALLGVIVPIGVALGFRHYDFYYVADIRIVKYFVHPPLWWSVTGLAVVGLSLAYGNVWCRWLCPLGAIYGTVGTASLTNVCRDTEACASCGKCAQACPNRVPVDKLSIVRAPECDGCQTCVRTCTQPGALEPRILGRWRLAWWTWPVTALALWLGIYAVAVLTHNWASPLPVSAFRDALSGFVP
jgi:polyferredoxin